MANLRSLFVVLALLGAALPAFAAFDGIPIVHRVDGGLEITCQYGYIRDVSHAESSLSAPLDMEGGFTYRVNLPETNPNDIARMGMLPEVRRRLCPTYGNYTQIRRRLRLGESAGMNEIPVSIFTNDVIAYFRDSEHVTAAISDENMRVEPALSGGVRFDMRAGTCTLTGNPSSGSRPLSPGDRAQVCHGLRMKSLRDGLRGCLEMINSAITPDSDRGVASVNDMEAAFRADHADELPNYRPAVPSSAMCSHLASAFSADRNMLRALLNEVIPSGCDGVTAVRAIAPELLSYPSRRMSLHIRGRDHNTPPSLLEDYTNNVFGVSAGAAGGDTLENLLPVRLNAIRSSVDRCATAAASAPEEVPAPSVESSSAACDETWSSALGAVFADSSALTTAVCDNVRGWRDNYTRNCRSWILGGRTDRNFRIAPPRAESPNSLLRARTLACRCAAAFPDMPRRNPRQPIGDGLPRGETCSLYSGYDSSDDFTSSTELFSPDTVRPRRRGGRAAPEAAGAESAE